MTFFITHHLTLINELTEIINEDEPTSKNWEKIAFEISFLVDTWTEHGDGKEAAYPIRTLFEWITANQNVVPYDYLLDISDLTDDTYTSSFDPCKDISGHCLLASYGKWLITSKIDAYGNAPPPSEALNDHGASRWDVFEFKSVCIFEAYECLSLSLKLKANHAEKHDVSPPKKIDFESFIKEAKSSLARNAANARHTENRDMKAQALEYYTNSKDAYANKDEAAIAITKLVPVKFSTAREWLKNK